MKIALTGLLTLTSLTMMSSLFIGYSVDALTTEEKRPGRTPDACCDVG